MSTTEKDGDFPRTEAPPLGIIPEWAWLELRVGDLNEAILRYQHAGLQPSPEWLEERIRHLTWLASRDSVAQREGSWQPIATAPKEEIPVLLWWPYWSHEPVIGEWDKRCEQWESTASLSSDGPGPTHWQPLPSPPVGAA